MFFFKHIHIKISKSSLRVHTHIFLNKEKRTSQSTWEEGSMTVEAAVVLPLLLIAFMALILFGKLYILQMQVDGALIEAARQGSRRAYLYEREEIDGGTLSYAKLCCKVLMRQLDVSEGIEVSRFHFVGSKYNEKTEELKLKLNYQVKIPLLLFGTWKVSFTTSVTQKVWLGYLPKSDEKYASAAAVYITQDGEVYHKDSQCYHLHVSIETVHNTKAYYEDNTRYEACSYCVEGGPKEVLYITKEGECYHESNSCGGLTRRVHVVSDAEKGGRRPCSDCCP